MERDEIRLEVLKLAFRHDRHPAEVVEVAQIFEKYILEPEEKVSASEKPKPKKVEKSGALKSEPAKTV